jgi:uncharacterized membrane protein YfcA
MTPLQGISISGLGLAAGLIGGLAGVGGSLVMLPGLHFLSIRAAPEDHHLFVAAAMTVNVAVAVPSAIQHAKAGAVRRDLLPTLLVAALAFIIAGVLASNRVSGDALTIALAVFILGYCAMNLWRLSRAKHDHAPGDERSTRLRLLFCGACAGSVAGLLGLGGGVVLVPLLQVLCRVPLRQSIATSSAVICLTATIGAAIKLGTLSQHDRSVAAALTLAGLMAPTAVVGGILGARLTHRLPLRAVRAVVTVLLLAAAINLLSKSL